jgi:hypothetical protein
MDTFHRREYMGLDADMIEKTANQEGSMTRYKMRIQIEMIPCEDVPTSEPVKAHDGSVSIVLSETDAMNIDACEQALLQTTYPTLRETLATHLSEVSKKKPVSIDMRAQ